MNKSSEYRLTCYICLSRQVQLQRASQLQIMRKQEPSATAFYIRDVKIQNCNVRYCHGLYQLSTTHVTLNESDASESIT